LILGTLNIDSILLEELHKNAVKTVSLEKDQDVSYDAIFIDFFPTKSDNTPEKAAKLVLQATVIEKNVKKKKPIIIFDRYLGLTQKEYNWISSSVKSKFFEPAINYRRNFSYLPFWYRSKNLLDIKLNNSQRPYFLAYKGNLNDRIHSFEKYYLYVAKNYPELKIIYDKKIDKVKAEEYSNFGIEYKKFEYSEVQHTIILGTKKEYEIGYLDSFTFKALDQNCIPIIPVEHRYFKSIDQNFDIHFYNKMYESTYVGQILEIYSNLDKYYPEMKVENVAKNILESVKNLI